jgi:hypothetical protein
MVNRVLASVIGVILMLGGALATLVGGALMAVLGSDSTLTTGQERVSTSTSALVTSIDNIEGTSGVASALGQPRLRLSASSADRPVFIGVGPASAVDTYLAGAAIDKVADLDLDPFALHTERHDGTARPKAPTAQTFWVASGDGSDAWLDWKIRDGSYRLVVMNADATPGVAIDGEFALKAPRLFGIGVGMLVAGIVGTLIGLVLFVIGLRTPERPRQGQPALV